MADLLIVKVVWLINIDNSLKKWIIQVVVMIENTMLFMYNI